MCSVWTDFLKDKVRFLVPHWMIYNSWTDCDPSSSMKNGMALLGFGIHSKHCYICVSQVYSRYTHVYLDTAFYLCYLNQVTLPLQIVDNIYKGFSHYHISGHKTHYFGRFQEGKQIPWSMGKYQKGLGSLKLGATCWGCSLGPVHEGQPDTVCQCWGHMAWPYKSHLACGAAHWGPIWHADPGLQAGSNAAY